MPYQLLKQNIANHVNFSDEQFTTYSRFFELKKVAKKEYLLQQGNICEFEGFVTKGCFRVFKIDTEGKEHVLYFAVEDWWISDIDSFANKTPSFLSIQALEDSEVLIVEKKNKEELYNQLPITERLFRIMAQKNLVVMQRRLIQQYSQTAEERYSNFITKYPQIVQKLTNLHLASYLGISHEFLSKIRKKKFSKRM